MLTVTDVCVVPDEDEEVPGPNTVLVADLRVVRIEPSSHPPKHLLQTLSP